MQKPCLSLSLSRTGRRIKTMTSVLLWPKMICHNNQPTCQYNSTTANKVTFNQQFQLDQVSDGRRLFSKTITQRLTNFRKRRPSPKAYIFEKMMERRRKKAKRTAEKAIAAEAAAAASTSATPLRVRRKKSKGTSKSKGKNTSDGSRSSKQILTRKRQHIRSATPSIEIIWRWREKCFFLIG